jgi:hypothetical protein
LKPGKDHPWVREAIDGFERHKRKTRTDDSDRCGPNNEIDTMKFYNEEDRVERIIRTMLSSMSLEELFAIETGLDQAIATAKGKAKERANNLIFAERQK